MYSARTRVRARIPNGRPREEKRACRTKVRGQVGELNGPRAPRHATTSARAGHANFRARILGVGVCVRVGPVEFNLSFRFALRTRTRDRIGC